MLIGNYSTKLSSKGRTAIPKKFRQQLGNQVIISQGYEQTLIIVPINTWGKLVNPDKPFILDVARETDRFLLGNAFEANLDHQGRIIIPSTLIKYAQLKTDIIFVGVGNRVEIWSQSSWNEYQQYLNKNSATIANKLINQQSQNNKQ